MAAGGFREFIAGETLDEDAINDYLMQGMLVFPGTAARGSAITSPVEGQFSFLKDSDSVEFFDGSQWVEFESGLPQFDFLVIAGGGSGGASVSGNGGGGAGGYRNSTGTSGGTAVAENPVFLVKGVNYLVTVGGGGSGASASSSNGSNSQFSSVISNGGDRGGGPTFFPPNIGGSGGGALGWENSNGNGLGGKAHPRQGFDGGTGLRSSVSITDQSGGGGGGAGAVGANGTSGSAGNGGAGLASDITGSSVTRGGGGGGGKRSGGTAGSGGTGGGGAGGFQADGSPGTVNTGGGGGGGGGNDPTERIGGNGGSGVVIIKYPDKITLTIGGGLTSSTSTSGGFKVTTFTAGTDVISF